MVVTLLKSLASPDELDTGASSGKFGITEIVALVDNEGPKDATVMVAVGVLLGSGLVANV